MEINAQKVKQLRQERSWTQQHLAQASGISLRTVQRIERYGTTSNETFMSLCAVLEVKADILRQQTPHIIEVEPERDNEQVNVTKLILASVAGGAVLGSIFTYIILGIG